MNCRMPRYLWTLVAFVALAPLSGCKQMSAWTNVAPSVSTPSADPFGYPPAGDSYYHRPELAPQLSPVPNLPSPGHSPPLDPPPPPVPGEAASSRESEDSVAAKPKSLWKLPSLFNRKGTRPEPLPSEDEEPEPTGSLGPAAKSLPLPISKPESTSSVGFHSARPVNHGEPAEAKTPSLNAKPAQPEPLPLPDGYSGPIITPGAQYTTGREVGIEEWPHVQRSKVSERVAVRLRHAPSTMSADDFAPQDQQLPAKPVAAQSSSPPATMPLLLAPGP